MNTNNTSNTIHILIVDDTTLNRTVLEKQLYKYISSYKNIYIKTLKSGEDCLEYLKINNVDIIFMDEYMTPGELLGSETVIEIRKLNYNIKIIHYSTNSSIEDTQKYLNAGSDLVLKKPYPIKTIDNIIYNLLNTL